ncbi:MAG: DivIVA domain-containing protein [Acidimicrobiales bacterium]
MHLTPEQIDRQPFRMRRRGYDMVQVRNFLRDIAEEMRARQDVRDRLVTAGNHTALADNEALAILDDARARADEMLSTARAAVIDGDLEGAKEQARLILQNAETEASQLVDSAEQTARERSTAVLAETQQRLDQLLAEERELRDRLTSDVPVEAPEEPPPDSYHREKDPTPTGASFADAMKSAVRSELDPTAD